MQLGEVKVVQTYRRRCSLGNDLLEEVLAGGWLAGGGAHWGMACWRRGLSGGWALGVNSLAYLQFAPSAL